MKLIPGADVIVVDASPRGEVVRVDRIARLCRGGRFTLASGLPGEVYASPTLDGYTGLHEVNHRGHFVLVVSESNMAEVELRIKLSERRERWKWICDGFAELASRDLAGRLTDEALTSLEGFLKRIGIGG